MHQPSLAIIPIATSADMAPFWHGRAEQVPVWREACCKASLRAGRGRARVRREAFSKASVRV
eukprot:5048866-Lingulodinium_polyedra.AAC.1